MGANGNALRSIRTLRILRSLRVLRVLKVLWEPCPLDGQTSVMPVCEYIILSCSQQGYPSSAYL
jgi:hypothetical protein